MRSSAPVVDEEEADRRVGRGEVQERLPVEAGLFVEARDDQDEAGWQHRSATRRDPRTREKHSPVRPHLNPPYNHPDVARAKLLPGVCSSGGDVKTTIDRCRCELRGDWAARHDPLGPGAARKPGRRTAEVARPRRSAAHAAGGRSRTGGPACRSPGRRGRALRRQGPVGVDDGQGRAGQVAREGRLHGGGEGQRARSRPSADSATASSTSSGPRPRLRSARARTAGTAACSS